MYPVLFRQDAASWDNFGIGVLSDAISCEVEEKRNGSYELEMEYPITGAFFDQIELRCIVLAKPNYTDDPQPFRIYNISKPLNGIVTISAQHISYDLSGYIDAPFTAAGIQIALGKLTDANVIYPSGCPFTFSTDIQSAVQMTLKHPESVRGVLGGVEGSLIDTYGGEWHFDGYDCTLYNERGEDRGVLIRYGKNLTDLRQEENNADVYTAVYPYYYNEDSDTLITLPEKVIQVTGTFPFTRVMPLDLSFDFEEAPNQTQLRAKAESYITENKIGVPKVNLTVSFLEPGTMSERVDLCDIVSVQFDELGVTASAKCIRTRWDVLKGQYIEAELGSAKVSLEEAIARSTEIAKVIDARTSQFQSIATGIISKVTGNQGGYIVLHDTNNDGEPDEILILDSDDITQAVNVIRMNNSGIAFSNSGYAGTYITAWNIDGEFVADFIAAGELKTDLVTILGDTHFYWDSNNISIVDPQDSDRIIRFGKYDGTNYGLGFSVDGGTTWKSGFSFEGIKMIGDADNAGYVKMDGDSFDIVNANDVSLCHLGIGTVNAEDGTIIQGPYYRLGTFATGATHGEYSFSAGRYSHPIGAHSVCVGYNNTSNGVGSVTIGKNSISSDNAGIAIGNNVESSGASTTTIDGVTYPIGSIAIGSKTKATSARAIAIGAEASALNTSSVAIGSSAYAPESSTVAIGILAKSTMTSAMALGDRAIAETMASVAIGFSAECNGAGNRYQVAIGYDAESSGHASCSIGYLAKSVGYGACAIGFESSAGGDYSCAVGTQADSSGQTSCSIGYNAIASGSYASAIGPSTTASGKSSYSFGPASEASGDWSVTMGNHCIANAKHAHSYGNYCTAAQEGQFVFGQFNAATTARFVFGNGQHDNQRSNAAFISAVGNMWIAGSLTQGSDGRYKNIIGNVPDLSGVRAVKFRWKDDGLHDQQEHIGYIAQDVEPVAPYLVQTDETTGFKSLDYIGLLCAKIEQLEQTVGHLTKRVEELEGVKG